MDKECLRGYEISELLGSGAFGKVYEACKPDCIYAIKIVEVDDDEAQKEFVFEARVPAEILKGTGIASKTYGWWICNEDGYIVTEKYDMSLKDYLDVYREITKDVYDDIEQKIHKLHKLNIIHGDLWPRNIMINVDGINIIDLVFIDWGMSRPMDDVDYEPWIWRQIKQSYQSTLGIKIFPYIVEELKANPKLLDYAILDFLKPMVVKKISKKPYNPRYIKIWKFLKTYGVDVDIDKLLKLDSLKIYHNNIQILPKEIGLLKNLKYLDIKDNILKSIPKELGNLTQLQHLDLGSNRLESIPKELGNLEKLQRLNISNNLLTSIPKELGNLKQLTLLLLEKNKFTDEEKKKIKKEFSYVKKLVI